MSTHPSPPPGETAPLLPKPADEESVPVLEQGQASQDAREETELKHAEPWTARSIAWYTGLVVVGLVALGLLIKGLIDSGDTDVRPLQVYA